MGEDRPLELELLRRYDRPGPRYTSYPTAPHFSSAFGAEEFVRFASARSSGGPQPPLSLYVHIPFCSSPCFYCGCNRVITRSGDRAAAYVDRLVREVRLTAPLFAGREVVQLHFGGGTPNFLTPEQLGSLIDAIEREFHFAARPRRELSIEMDPRFARPEDFGKLARSGINRASFGVQDFDLDVQLAVNRVQSAEQTLGALQACRAAGIRSINLDLMYGLPRQSRSGFRQTLQAVIDARPTRLAIYGYAHLPQLFKAQSRIQSNELPDAQTRIALLGLAIDTLSEAGYRYIGMDHFALPEDELVRAQDAGTLHRNFMGYTTQAGCDLLGLGVSAISHLGESFSQNPRELEVWEAAIDSGRFPVWRGLSLDADDTLRADIIGRIMCQGEVDIGAIEQRYAIDFWTYFATAREQLARLEADGLLWMCASRILATRPGRFLLRAIAGCFDRYLPPPTALQSPLTAFSKVL